MVCGGNEAEPALDWSTTRHTSGRSGDDTGPGGQLGNAFAVDRLSGDADPAARRRAAARPVIRVATTGRIESRGGNSVADQRSLRDDHPMN